MAFASASWWSKFPLCQLKVLRTSIPDHEPIYLELIQLDISVKKFRFHFEKEPCLFANVTKAWNNIPFVHLLPKLIQLSSFRERWGRNFFHKFKDKVKEHKHTLDLLSEKIDEESVKKYLEAKALLNDLLAQE
ncbi:uncharacterized protein LOC141707840 [Apium graveolens]|uniref:uncharacterized protein LOC141707840 n=1 Tax=Apium graveolens TaxID=4045 RepID=UPI003D79C52A